MGSCNECTFSSASLEGGSMSLSSNHTSLEHSTFGFDTLVDWNLANVVSNYSSTSYLIADIDTFTGSSDVFDSFNGICVISEKSFIADRFLL